MPPRCVLEGYVLKPKSTEVTHQKSRVLDHVRHLSHDDWPRRYLCLIQEADGEHLSYSERKGGDVLKRIKVSDILEVSPLDPRSALKERIPQVSLIEQCFYVKTHEKRIVFASTDGKQAQWLSTLRSLNINGVSDGSEDESSDYASNDSFEDDAEFDSLFDDADANFADEEDEEDEEEEEEDEDECCDDNSDLSCPSSPGSPIESSLAASPRIDLSGESLALVRSIVKERRIHFAARCTKFSSKDKDLERLLAVTDSDLFIIEKGRLRNHKTKIPIHQITGVIRNIHDDAQLAVLWCQGHDYLFTFTDNGAETAEHFVAHLAKQHSHSKERGAFMVRESLNILTAIRRTESDSYEPLETCALDKLSAGTEPDVASLLRMNGDAKVWLSDIVIKENASGDRSDKLIVVTDLAVYFFKKDLTHLTRRIALKEIKCLLCYEPECYILIQMMHGERAHRHGDILFCGKDNQDSTYKAFLDIVGKSAVGSPLQHSHSITVTKAKYKAKLFQDGRLDKKDTITKIHSGARKIKVKELKKVGKKMRVLTQKLGGNIFHLSEDVVKGAAHGAVRVFEGSVGIVSDMVGLTSGLGLHPSTIQAAEAIRVSTDKLTGPRGNSVFLPLAASAMSDLSRSRNETKEVEKGALTQYVKENLRKNDDILPIPEREEVWFAFPATDLLDSHHSGVVVVLTSKYFIMYQDSSKHDGRPLLKRHHRLFHSHLQHVTLLVDCIGATDIFLIGFKEKDFILSTRHRFIETFRKYLFRRCEKMRKKHPEAELMLGSVETTDHLKILKCGADVKGLPQKALQPVSDGIHLAACENVIKELSQFAETVVYFSGVADAQIYKGETGEGRRSFDTRKYFVVVTNAAFYLIGSPSKDEPLAVRRRLFLPLISGLLINEARCSDVLVQSLHYKITVKAPFKKKMIPEVELTQLLQDALDLPFCIDVMGKTQDTLVLRLFPVAIEGVKRAKTRLFIALKDFFPKIFIGGANPEDGELEVTDEIEHDDLLLAFDSHSEDFCTQLTRARIQWTSFEMPQVTKEATPPEALCDLAKVFVKCPENKTSSGNPLAGFAKFPSAARQAEVTAVPQPGSVKAVHHRWISRRLRRALDLESADLLCYELRKGEALNLISAQERREIWRANRGRMSVSPAHRVKIMSQLAYYITDERFADFERLATRAADILTRDVTACTNKTFLQRAEWTRHQNESVSNIYFDGFELQSGTMTIEDAKIWCLQNKRCVGFTHRGPSTQKGEVFITFRTSHLNEEKLKERRPYAQALDWSAKESSVGPASPTRLGLQRSISTASGLRANNSPLLGGNLLQASPRGLMKSASLQNVASMASPTAGSMYAATPISLSQRGSPFLSASQATANPLMSSVCIPLGTVTTAPPRNTVCTGVFPNQENLVNVLNETTWLKSADQLQLLHRKKREASEQKSCLQTIEVLIPKITRFEVPRRIDLDEIGFEIIRAQQQIKESQTAEKAGKFLGSVTNQDHFQDMLSTLQVVLTATVQRALIRKNSLTDEDHAELLNTDPVAVRLQQLSWTSLSRDDDDEDEDELHGLQYLASSIWNGLVDMDLLNCRETDLNVMSTSEFYLNELIGDFEEAVDLADIPFTEDLIERAVKHRWLGLCEDQQEADDAVSEILDGGEETAFQHIIWKKRIDDCVTYGDLSGLDDIQGESGKVMNSHLEEAYREINNRKDRAVLSARVQNVLSTATRTFTLVRQASEQELSSVVLGLEELLPQAQQYPSLSSEALTLSFLLTILRGHLMSKRAETARAEYEETKKAEQALRVREQEELLQRRIDQKEMEKIRRAEAVTQKIHDRCAKLQQIFNESCTAFSKPDEAACRRRRNDCIATLTDAKSHITTAPSETLTAAITLLSNLVEQWTEAMVGKEEIERNILNNKITEVIASRDRNLYYSFAKEHLEGLQTDQVMRLKLGWAGFQSELEAQAEVLKKLKASLKYRDKYELTKNIEEAVTLGIPEDDEILVEATVLLAELQGACSPRDEDQQDSEPALSETAKAAAEDSSNDSDDDILLETHCLRVAAFDAASPISTAPSPQDTASPSDDAASPRFLSSPSTDGAKSPPTNASQAFPSAPSLPPPPAGSEPLIGLYKALQGLKEASETDSYGRTRCQLNNPWVKLYVDAWKVLIKYKLKKKNGGLFKKVERTELDVFTEVATTDFTTQRAMDGFVIARKVNSPNECQDTFCLQYLLQSGRFFHVIQSVLQADTTLLTKLYEKGASFSKDCDREYLFCHFLKAIKTLRFDFRYTMTEDDIEYMVTIDAADMPPPPPRLPTPPPETDQKEKIEPKKEEEMAEEKEKEKGEEEEDEDEDGWHDVTEKAPEAKVDILSLVMQSCEFKKVGEVAKLKIAVRQLIGYYTEMKKQLKVTKGSKLKGIFDEGKNPTLGVLSRERLCPALVSLMMHAFKDTVRFKKRHLWQFIESTAATKRKTATDLGSVKLPEAIDTVKNVIDLRISQAKGAPLTAPVNDLKLRALICYALNKSHLKLYMETLFDTSPDAAHIHKDWYHSNALIYDKETRAEVDGIVEMLDGLGFHLLLDVDVY